MRPKDCTQLVSWALNLETYLCVKEREGAKEEAALRDGESGKGVCGGGPSEQDSTYT